MEGSCAGSRDARRSRARPACRHAGRMMQRVLLVGCGDVALRVAQRLAHRARLIGLTRDRDDVREAPRAWHRPARRRPRRSPHARPPEDRAVRGAAFRAAALRRQGRPAHAPSAGGACERADYTAAHRLHLDVGRVWRLRRRAGCSKRGRAGRRRRARAAASRPRIACAAGPRITVRRCRSSACRAFTRRRACRSSGSSRARRCSHPTTTSTPNHIHADDLARAVVAALYHGRPNRAYNVSDDSEMKMGAWFDTVADAFHLPRPPRVALGRRRAADRADAAVVHERIAAPVQRTAEARAARASRASDAACDARADRAARSSRKQLRARRSDATP